MAEVDPGPTDWDAAESFDDDMDLAKAIGRSNGLRFINGLRTFNGSAQVNGMRVINGLRVGNGLRVVNGLEVIMGLGTKGGASQVNGKYVNCATSSVCTGEPDGLMSRTEGLMATEDGIMTAQYLVRCALDAGQTLKIKDYRGQLRTLKGSIGLCGRWLNGNSTEACEEKVTACLLSLTNGDARNVAIELSSPNLSRIGGGHSLPSQEAAFYGNIFSASPTAYACMGTDVHVPRMVEGYQELLHGAAVDLWANASETAYWQSPYYIMGYCHGPRAACTYSGEEPASCVGMDGRSYSKVVTSYRTLTSDNVRLVAADYYARRCARNSGDTRACSWDYSKGWTLTPE